MSIFTWNVILDMRTSPKQVSTTSTFFLKVPGLRNLWFATQWKKYEPLHDLCYRHWEPLTLGCCWTKNESGTLCSDWHIHRTGVALFTLQPHYHQGEASSHENNATLSCTAKIEQTIQIPNVPSIDSRDLSDEQWRCKFLQQGKANPSPRALSLKWWGYGAGKSCLLSLSRSIATVVAEARLCFPNHWDMWPFHVAGCLPR